jgi:hypothetical protein
MSVFVAMALHLLRVLAFQNFSMYVQDVEHRDAKHASEDSRQRAADVQADARRSNGEVSSICSCGE